MYMIIICLLIYVSYKYIKNKYNKENIYIEQNKNDNLKLANYYHKNNNGKKALFYYQKCLDQKNYFVMYDIANIYNFGLSDTKPNLYLAYLYYSKLAEINFNASNKKIYNYKIDRYKNNTNDKLEQLINVINNDNKKFMRDKRKINVNKFLINSIFDGFDKSNLFINQPINLKIKDHVNRNNIDTKLITQNTDVDVIDLSILDDNIVQDIIYNDITNDPQNIHDTHINKTIQQSITKLKKSTTLKYDYDTIIDILLLEIYRNHKDKIENITSVLEKIENSKDKSIYNDMKLQYLLVLVGNKILNSEDKEYKETCMNNLIIELNYCVEDGNLICFTGIFNHIINSLNYIDNEVNIKSKDILNIEMMNKCSTLRKELEKKNIADDIFDDKLKELIRLELKKDYVDTNILSQIELDNIINSWINYI